MRVVTVVVGLAMSAATAFAQGAGMGAAAEAEAIRSVTARYTKAVAAQDPKAVAAVYTEDAIEMPPHQPAVKGRAAIEAYYRKLFADPNVKMSNFTINHVATDTRGDLAYDVGTYRQQITRGGQTMQDTGKYTVILKKVSGEWKAAYAIYNSDQAPMTPGGP